MFEQDALDKIIATTLPPPASAQLAIVGTVNQTGAQVALVFTSKADKWNLTGMYRHDRVTGDSAEAKLIFKL